MKRLQIWLLAALLAFAALCVSAPYALAEEAGGSGGEIVSGDSESEQVTIPDEVIDRSPTEAADLLEAARLIVGTEPSYEYSNTVPKDNVCGTNPPVGTTVDVGSTVNLIISLGKKQVTIPDDVVGKSPAEAKTLFEAAGLIVGTEPSYEYSNTVPKDNVCGTNPPVGTTLDEGSTVDLVISLGKKQAEVPNVVGKSPAEAKALFEAAGLIVGTSTSYEYSATVPKDLVCGTNPPVGTTVDEGSTVDLVISLGPASVDIPNVTGKKENEAESALTEAGFKVAKKYEYSTDFAKGIVISQSHTGKADPGATITLYISLGKQPGWTVLDGDTYYVNADGTFAKGIKQIDGEYYWFDESTGILQTDVWKKISDTWYFFGSDGKRYHNSFLFYENDVYYFKTDGTVQYGWFKRNSQWFYANSTGRLYHNKWLNSNGKWCYFDVECHMVTSAFAVEDDATYRFDANGHVVIGWFKVDGKWYYAGRDGKLYKDQWLKYNNKWYYFDSFGNPLASDYVVYNGGVYWFGSNGTLTFGWMGGSGTWYYAGSNGRLYHNQSIKYGGKTYYFGSDYKLQTNTNWVLYNGRWYYKKSNNSYAVGWNRIGGNWHYFNGNRSALTGWVKSDGKWYFFGEYGRFCANEWISWKGSYYHLDAKGNPQTGWQTIDGASYYLGTDGVLVLDDWVESGNTYYRVDSDGKYLTSLSPVVVEKRSVKTSEGTVQGLFIAPKGVSSAPTIVFSHGLGGTGTNFMDNALELAGNGIAVYIFDFVGGSPTSASGGSFQKMTIDTEKSQLNAIVDEVLTWKEVDSHRLYLAGHSQGGLLSTLIASSRSDIAGIVLISPALNLGELVRATFGSLDKVPSTFTFLNKRLGRAYAEALWDVNVRDVANGYTGTSLVFHGLDDDIIDPSVSVAAYQFWGASCTIHSIPGVDHTSIINFSPELVEQICAYVKAY